VFTLSLKFFEECARESWRHDAAVGRKKRLDTNVARAADSLMFTEGTVPIDEVDQYFNTTLSLDDHAAESESGAAAAAEGGPSGDDVVPAHQEPDMSELLKGAPAHLTDLLKDEKTAHVVP
jgi:hypothetical protein